jgi:hypothetical protein
MSVYHLLFDRGLQQLARSFLEQLFEKRLLFIFSSLIKRDHFILWHWRILSFWRPRVRPPAFFLLLRGLHGAGSAAAKMLVAWIGT